VQLRIFEQVTGGDKVKQWDRDRADVDAAMRVVEMAELAHIDGVAAELALKGLIQVEGRPGSPELLQRAWEACPRAQDLFETWVEQLYDEADFGKDPGANHGDACRGIVEEMGEFFFAWFTFARQCTNDAICPSPFDEDGDPRVVLGVARVRVRSSCFCRACETGRVGRTFCRWRRTRSLWQPWRSASNSPRCARGSRACACGRSTGRSAAAACAAGAR